MNQVMSQACASAVIASLALDWGELYRQQNIMTDFKQAF